MYNGASIVDLKAELSRKDDLLKASGRKSNLNDNTKGKSTFNKIQSLTGKRKKKKQKDNSSDETKEVLPAISDETYEMLAKSRQKLAAKAKIYDKMISGEMEDVESSHGETKFLVDFHKKYQENHRDESSSDEERDQLKPFGSTSIYEADEEYREKLHEKWEAEQKELLDGPIHYENVKFDEVRELGTGYYAFSKNEEERHKQMEELQKLHDRTIDIQKGKEMLKNKRKLALQERLKKIKQRKLGLDVEEETAEEVLSNTELSSEKDETSSSMTLDNIEGVDSIIKECRKSSLPEREWDKTKRVQKFVPERKPKSLNDFVTERRNERLNEFAPPNIY